MKPTVVVPLRAELVERRTEIFLRVFSLKLHIKHEDDLVPAIVEEIPSPLTAA